MATHTGVKNQREMHTDKEKQIAVQISYAELRQLLKKVLNTPHAELLSHVIMGNLEVSSHGLEQTYKAIQGITNELPWKAGQHVLVKKEGIYNSSIEWTKMEEQGLIHQGYMKGIISKVDIYSYSPVFVDMKIVTALEIKDYNTSIGVSYLKPGEEWPENLKAEEDLPF